jgi:hypothetical protein
VVGADCPTASDQDRAVTVLFVVNSGVETADDPWEFFTGVAADGTEFLARFATRYRDDEPFRREHTIRIGIAIPFSWRLRARHGARLEAIEEEVISAAGDATTLVGVITTSKMREFVLYSGAPERIPDFHDELRRAFPKYDVQVVAEEDPDWQVYDDFNRR